MASQGLFAHYSQPQQLPIFFSQNSLYQQLWTLFLQASAAFVKQVFGRSAIKQKVMDHKMKKACYIFIIILGLASCNTSQQLLDPMLSLRPHPDAFGKRADSTCSKVQSEILLHNDLHGIAKSTLQAKYARLLNVPAGFITNHPLYNFIDDWVGVQHCIGGNNRSGIDCSGFAQLLYENVYCMNLMRTASQQFQKCRRVLRKDALQEGDLVFFRTQGKKRINHVGVYLLNDFFVHSSTSQGVVVSNLNEKYWLKRYAGGGRIL